MGDGLRDFLQALRDSGQMVEIRSSVDPVRQASALLAEAYAHDAAVFMPSVDGYPECAIAGNLFGSRRRAAMALGVDEERLDATVAERWRRPVEPRWVPDGPVRERVFTGDPDVLEHVPVLMNYEGDAGRYIVSGVVLAREPDGRRIGLGIHRIQVRSPRRLGVYLHSPPLGDYLRQAEARGRPLDLTIALGSEPAVTFAGALHAGPDEDKVALAGGLAGAPIELIAGLTVDAPAPARAEFVLEGRVLPGLRETEGPCGESTGTYLTFQSPVVEVTAVTSRSSPVYPALLPWSPDVDLLQQLGALGHELARLRQAAPCVRDLRLVPGSCGLWVVVQVAPARREEVRAALAAALTLLRSAKLAVAVDEDVNPGDMREVAWALATRTQPDRDLIGLAGLPGLSIDPSAAGGSTAKLGLDATFPADERRRWPRVHAPEAAVRWARRLWADSTRGT